MININGEKMSKSLNNFKLAKDMVQEYGGNLVRMCLLSAPYRSPVNFSDELIKSSKMELDKVLNAMKLANVRLQVNENKNDKFDNELVENFLKEIANDLNVANGFTVLYEVVKKLNVGVRANDLDSISKYFNTVVEINKILSFDLELKTLTNEDVALYKQWEDYKKQKDFTNADACRDQLISKGVL